MKVSSYRELIVWKKSVELVLIIYKLTEQYPSAERYGLVSQMRRAAVSIPANIAEGSRRSSRKDFRNFLINAYGSGAELETYIEISKKLWFKEKIDFNEVEGILDEVMRMLNKLIHELEA